MLKQLVYGLIFAGMSTIAAPTLAQAQPTTQQQQAAKPSYADQVICETQEETGSRLASHKICHTRSQWTQIRQDDRSLTEHTQMQRSMDQNGH